MTDFVSVLDLLEDAPYGAHRQIADELVDIENGIRKTMDQGLTPDEKCRSSFQNVLFLGKKNHTTLQSNAQAASTI